ncbi:hypothetical protein M422DRAFT_25961 [Sphaerobolus stellatus SS14]|nr:hypothetical protein M422DRAFT_25961 [Sphaerobolus stellatus SS14]
MTVFFKAVQNARMRYLEIRRHLNAHFNHRVCPLFGGIDLPSPTNSENGPPLRQSQARHRERHPIYIPLDRRREEPGELRGHPRRPQEADISPMRRVVPAHMINQHAPPPNGQFPRPRHPNYVPPDRRREEPEEFRGHPGRPEAGFPHMRWVDPTSMINQHAPPPNGHFPGPQHLNHVSPDRRRREEAAEPPHRRREEREEFRGHDQHAPPPNGHLPRPMATSQFIRLPSGGFRWTGAEFVATGNTTTERSYIVEHTRTMNQSQQFL